MDASGKIVRQSAAVSTSPYQYDVSDLKAGIYVLRLTGSQEVQLIRFVKQ
jgi:hypothetical protein